MTGKTLFISAVTDEFASRRRELVDAFDGPGLDAKSQDELYDSGEPTLLKLADYIRKSDAVVHVIGDMGGRVADAAAHARSRDALLERYPDVAAKLPALAVDEYGNDGDETDPDIPDAVVRHIFADPDAQDLLRDCMRQNDLSGAPADLPFPAQKAIVAALVKTGAIEIGTQTDTPEARERSSWIAHALSRLIPFRRKH